MAHQPLLEQLNHLIQINKDAEAGFHTAAGNIGNSEIQTLFEGYAIQHARFAEEIQSEVERVGSQPSDSGSFGGVVNRGWMDLKAALTGHSVGSMLSTCQSGELSAESAYLDALNVITSGHAHTLLEKHCEQIKGFRTRLARLVGEVKDGVDFQTNT